MKAAADQPMLAQAGYAKIKKSHKNAYRTFSGDNAWSPIPGTDSGWTNLADIFECLANCFYFAYQILLYCFQVIMQTGVLYRLRR